MTASAPPRGLSDTVRACLWMLGGIASFTTMAVAGREVSVTLDTFEIMLYRSVVGVIVVLAIGTATGSLRTVTTRNLPLQTVRNIAHFTGQNLWFLAITLAPLAQVFALEFTSPLWVLLLAPLLLGERVRAAQYAVAAIGFGGVLLVAQPFSGSISPGLVWAGLAAIAFAVTNLLTRRLTRTETVTGILFWLTVLQLVFGLIAAGYDGDIARPDAAALPFVVLIGFAGLTAHFCLTNALRLAPAATIMPIDFARLPLIAVIGALFYAEPLDPLVLFGGAVVFGAAWANLRLAERA
ncbi:DMT family transporter [uncultured Jannaschia sp.]|uniref:DMT family transporter n=1 Tax=uncultured Jannaschia sp. TaxID=293347 RepID=UPI00261CC11E|nr:DMT family transporter [uncultured Jannaschia sp.]